MMVKYEGIILYSNVFVAQFIDQNIYDVRQDLNRKLSKHAIEPKKKKIKKISINAYNL